MDFDQTKGNNNFDLYETIPGYPKPPMIPIADMYSKEAYFHAGVKRNNYSYNLTKAALHLSGFRKFINSSEESLEKIYRTTNMRLPGLYAPVISATIAIKDDPDICDPIKRAALLIIGTRKYCFDLMSGKVEPDRYGDHILEMGLYPNLFSTNIHIKKGKAVLSKSDDFSKVNIISNRKFFVLNLGPLERSIDYIQLCDILHQIKEKSILEIRSNNDLSIGLITAANNRTQFRAMKELVKDSGSKEALNMLNRTMFTMCLDFENHPASYKESAFLAHSTNHGNRWNYSSMQAVVAGNSKAAFIFSFTAYIDGNTMVRSAHEIYKRSSVNSNAKSENPSITYYSFRELKWKFPKKHIRAVMRDIKIISDNQQATFDIKDVGTDFFNHYKIDGVSIFIIALEKTLIDFIGRPVNIIQFLAMTKYRCMSLFEENVATTEVVQCVNGLEKDILSPIAKLALIKNAITSQKQKIRKRRKNLSLDKLFGIYVHTRKKISKIYVIILAIFFSILQKRIRLFSKERREVVISHPAIYPEVPIVGRPGARLPYVKYLALHFQILKDKITITILPSINFRIPNSEFLFFLKKNLFMIKNIIEESNSKYINKKYS